MGYFFWNFWLEESYRPQTLQAIALALGYPPEFNNKTVAEDTTYFSYRTWRYQAGTDLEASPILAKFHNAEGTVPCMLPEK